MADFYAYYPVPVNSGGGGSGTVTSVGTGTGLTGGPITTSGSISLVVPVVIANGGTNSTTALSNNRVMKSAGGAIVEAAAIPAARALISDANGIPTHSVTTATELGYVNGVTSSIQAQLDAKEPTLTPGDISTSSTYVTIGSGSASTVGPNVTVDITSGNLTAAGTDGIAVTSGTGVVLGSGTSIAQHVADSTHNGYLSSTDWSTFNGKQASGNYITALTGDVTATGPGSVASTVAKIAGTTVSGTTGTTNVVFSSSPTISSPTLSAPVLGTPSSGTLTNCTGLPIVGGTTGTLSVGRGGTNSTTALNNNRVMQSSGGSIVEASAITASRALVSDTNGIPVASTTSTTQVQYLASATGTTGTTSTNVVFSTSPTLVTPTLGVASATSINFGQSDLSYFQTGTQASTFTSDGTSGGTSSSVTIAVQRVGDFVTIFIPAFSASSGTGSPSRYTANSALPSWARPATATVSAIAGASRNNSANSGSPALIQLTTAGILVTFRDTAQTTFTTSSSCGMQSSATFSYFVGSGS